MLRGTDSNRSHTELRRDVFFRTDFEISEPIRTDRSTRGVKLHRPKCFTHGTVKSTRVLVRFERFLPSRAPSRHTPVLSPRNHMSKQLCAAKALKRSATPRGREMFLRSEVDGEMHLERMTSHTFNAWTRRLFEYAGGELAECTHHSIRRACVKWAARCGGSEHDIKRAGRWKTSSARFTQYWGDGQTSLEELEIMRTNNPNFVDPIYAVWRWQPIAFEATRGGDG